MDLPDAFNRLTDRPNIQGKPEDIELNYPSYLELKNYKNIDVIPIEIKVKEIRGTIDWN